MYVVTCPDSRLCPEQRFSGAGFANSEADRDVWGVHEGKGMEGFSTLDPRLGGGLWIVNMRIRVRMEG